MGGNRSLIDGGRIVAMVDEEGEGEFNSGSESTN